METHITADGDFDWDTNEVIAQRKANTSSTNIRGRNVSGRPWKEPHKPLSKLIAVKELHPSFQQKMERKIRDAAVVAKDREWKKEREELRQARKQRRAANIKKKEENELRSQVTQVITNNQKIKKLTKKQMRGIQKAATCSKHQEEGRE
eukprot:TRINITY_DN3398_c0_g1_i2.p1 TRINITY_DN3398_c0_g1~~TRINITY_DN3398_c0_g1_i2.p1  ORF type:complete len:149 (+),score=39.53 TRINITY_DN3398_c0_g1_i2:120-566(+)